MDRRRQVVLALCAASLATVSAAQTAIQHVLTKDTTSYALYFQTSQDGCESSGTEVFSSKSMTRYTNFGIFAPLVRAQRYFVNFCTGASGFMSGADEAPTIDIKPDLSRGAVGATVVMLDEAGVPHTLQIALTWSGGEITTDKQRTVFTSPLSRTMIISSASLRNSTLLNGALVFDGVNLMDTSIPVQTRFTTQFLVSAKGTSIDIVRTR